MKFVNKTILLISPEPWGVNYVSKHHYAIELAKRGNNVYFLNPPSGKNNLENISNNLHILDYNNLLRGVNRFPLLIKNIVHRYLIKKIKQLMNIDKIDIVWSFDPYRFQYLNLFNAALNIYHPVDIHKNQLLEQTIAKNSQMILGTSEIILKRFTTKLKAKINHGLSDSFVKYEFSSTLNSYPLKVGYVGNLHYQYIDKPILMKIITENPNIEFNFIGPYLKSNLSEKQFNKDLVQFLLKQRNCILHGVVPNSKLPNVLDSCHVLLMCYSGDKHKEEMANPHKLLEFLATGRVVLTHYIDEYKNHPELIVMAPQNEQLPTLFKEITSNISKYNSPAMQNTRKAWAQANTYEKQIERIEKLIANL